MSKKDSYWFTHDADAASDPKSIALIAKYGMAGYGMFWRLIEVLRSQSGYKYEVSSKFSYPAIADALKTTVDDAKAFIQDCISEFELLQTDGEYVWSQSLLDRMQRWDKTKENLSSRGSKGAEARWKDKKKEESTNTQPPELPLPATPANTKKDILTDEEIKQYSPEQVDSFRKFYKWVDDNAPSVNKLKEPFTIKQYLQAVKDFGKEKLTDVIQSMHNKADLTKKYKSAYLTFRNWAKNG